MCTPLCTPRMRVVAILQGGSSPARPNHLRTAHPELAHGKVSVQTGPQKSVPRTSRLQAPLLRMPFTSSRSKARNVVERLFPCAPLVSANAVASTTCVAMLPSFASAEESAALLSRSDADLRPGGEPPGEVPLPSADSGPKAAARRPPPAGSRSRPNRRRGRTGMRATRGRSAQPARRPPCPVIDGEDHLHPARLTQPALSLWTSARLSLPLCPGRAVPPLRSPPSLGGGTSPPARFRGRVREFRETKFAAHVAENGSSLCPNPRNLRGRTGSYGLGNIRARPHLVPMTISSTARAVLWVCTGVCTP
jgi:hypothetical protein